ncbi:unnamed protein product, partial [Ectocarpus sp. 6 AP-2014]
SLFAGACPSSRDTASSFRVGNLCTAEIILATRTARLWTESSHATNISWAETSTLRCMCQHTACALTSSVLRFPWPYCLKSQENVCGFRFLVLGVFHFPGFGRTYCLKRTPITIQMWALPFHRKTG